MCTTMSAVGRGDRIAFGHRSLPDPAGGRIASVFDVIVGEVCGRSFVRIVSPAIAERRAADDASGPLALWCDSGALTATAHAQTGGVLSFAFDPSTQAHAWIASGGAQVNQCVAIGTGMLASRHSGPPNRLGVRHAGTVKSGVRLLRGHAIIAYWKLL